MAETNTNAAETTQAENGSSGAYGGDPAKPVSPQGEKGVSTSEQGTQTEKTESAPTEKTEKSSGKTEEKRFSQSEVDEIISKRLARESKNAEKAENAAKENEALRQSLACYKAGVRDDCVDDAVTLANKLVNDKTDFSAALKKVIEKYPNFTSTGKEKATGVQMNDRSYSSSDADLRKAFGLKAK